MLISYIFFQKNEIKTILCVNEIGLTTVYTKEKLNKKISAALFNNLETKPVQFSFKIKWRSLFGYAFN